MLNCCLCCSVAKSCLTLSDPTDCSMPGLPIPHHLPKFAQVHVLCFIDAIQPILYIPILYIVSIVYKCQSQSPNSSHHHPFLLGIYMFVLNSCVSIFFCKSDHLYHLFPRGNENDFEEVYSDSS